jgi:hypothetical protein
MDWLKLNVPPYRRTSEVRPRSAPIGTLSVRRLLPLDQIHRAISQCSPSILFSRTNTPARDNTDISGDFERSGNCSILIDVAPLLWDRAKFPNHGFVEQLPERRLSLAVLSFLSIEPAHCTHCRGAARLRSFEISPRAAT